MIINIIEIHINEKKIGFWILSAVIVIGTILAIALSENETIKVLASTLLGGAFSLVVWLLKIRHQDNMNYEITKIEAGIMCIDDYIESIKGEIFLVDPLEYKIIKSNNHDAYTQFMRQWQMFKRLSLDKRIDTKAMKVVYMNKKECTVEEFGALCEKDAENGYEEIAFEECKEIIEYNYFLVNRELALLRKKLCRYKIYIYCGSFRS